MLVDNFLLAVLRDARTQYRALCGSVEPLQVFESSEMDGDKMLIALRMLRLHPQMRTLGEHGASFAAHVCCQSMLVRILAGLEWCMALLYGHSFWLKTAEYGGESVLQHQDSTSSCQDGQQHSFPFLTVLALSAPIFALPCLGAVYYNNPTIL